MSRLAVHVDSRRIAPGAGRSDPTETRERIKAAVRELLAEGTFHESTVEEVADRAGRRAGDALPALPLAARARRRDLRDLRREPRAARSSARPSSCPTRTPRSPRRSPTRSRFWSSEDPVLRQLYGVAADRPGRPGPRRPPARRPAQRARAARTPPRARRPAARRHERAARAQRCCCADELRDLPRAPRGRPLGPPGHDDSPAGRTHLLLD